ncbi:TIGR00266 family protein [bacterium]|nr:TIGR00266 family protein [bacterium]
MKASVIGTDSFQSLHVELSPGERFYSEAGKMVRCSSGVDIEVTLQKKGGGFMGALKRLLSSDSFFYSRYTAQGTGTSEVVIAPTMMGNVRVLELKGDETWITSGGSYLASGPEITSEAKWQGLGAGLLSGESLMFVHNRGIGFLAVEAFGTIHEVDVNGEFVVDTGHLVAFESSLSFTVGKVGGSWIKSFFSGEGFVMNFKGTGKLLMQSHNGSSFGGLLGPLLPKRRS